MYVVFYKMTAKSEWRVAQGFLIETLAYASASVLQAQGNHQAIVRFVELEP